MQHKINCIIVDDEHMARSVLQTHLQQINDVNIVATCKNAVEAFNAINDNKVDLIFLDINMPNISGLSFAKSINKNIQIIFTTAYRDYAVEGFDLQAVDYLLKPISLPRLIQAVDKFKATFNVREVQKTTKLSNKEKSDFIFIKVERKMLKINLDDIFYIESYSDYLKVHLQNKTILTRETISNIDEKLPQNKFMRVHRSYIISIPKIEAFTSEFIEVNKKAIPISRTYKKQVLQRLENG